MGDWGPFVVLISVGARIPWWLVSQTHGSFWTKSGGWRLRSSGNTAGGDEKRPHLVLLVLLFKVKHGGGAWATERSLPFVDQTSPPFAELGRRWCSRRLGSTACSPAGGRCGKVEAVSARSGSHSSRGQARVSIFTIVDASAGFTVHVLFYQEFFHHLSARTNRREWNHHPNNSRMLSNEDFCIVLKYLLWKRLIAFETHSHHHKKISSMLLSMQEKKDLSDSVNLIWAVANFEWL